MTERVHDIIAIEIDNYKDNRFVEIEVTTKYGNKVVLSLEWEMWEIMLSYLKNDTSNGLLIHHKEEGKNNE